MAKKKEVELHRQAFELYVQGLTLIEIASALGVSPNTLKYWKSKNCQCVCAFHDWVDFKKKVQAQVPQTVIDATSSALIPKMSAQMMIKQLEQICAEELGKTDGLRPKTWKELIETFKLLVDLRKVYGVTEEEDVTLTRTETRTVEEKIQIHTAVDDFVKQLHERQTQPKENVVDLLVDQSRSAL